MADKKTSKKAKAARAAALRAASAGIAAGSAARAAKKKKSGGRRNTGKLAAKARARMAAPLIGEKTIANVPLRCYSRRVGVRGGKMRQRGFCFDKSKLGPKAKKAAAK